MDPADPEATAGGEELLRSDQHTEIKEKLE